MNFDFLQNETYGKYIPKKTPTDYPKLLESLIKIGEKFEPKFEIKENSIEYEFYKNLLYYFTDNDKCKWNLSKGLFLSGKKGLGKSLCLKIISKMYFYKNNLPPMQIKKSFASIGMESLCVKQDGKLHNLDKFYNYTKMNLFCDEVMRESENKDKTINNFGTIEQPFSSGLHQMYRNFCDNGKIYHFTTNYWNVKGFENGKLIADTYGNEIHDRIIEMCNIIELKGESKRV